MYPELKTKLQELKSRPAKILIIEDHPLVSEAIEEVLLGIFPTASIHRLTADEWLDVQSVITKGDFALITLDGQLGQWPEHRIYGRIGYNIVPYIKTNSPETIIMSLSTSDESNRTAVSLGAHYGMNKSNLEEFKGVLE